MARWIPPIPKAAMYRRDAIRLGEALPLLLYCYDCVDRAGWVDLKLSIASDVLDVPYPTIKRWWRSIEKTGTIFIDVIVRGRSGLRVRFAPDWIDWSMPEGWQRPDETGSQSIPKETAQTENGTQTGSELISNSGNEHTNGIVIGTQTGSELIPKILHIGTHDLRSNNDDMRTENATIAAPTNDLNQPSSSSPVSHTEPETKRTNAQPKSQDDPTGESVALSPPLPPRPPSPGPSTALWADLGTDEQAWLTRAIPYESEQRRLLALVERHGRAFVTEGIHACVQQSGRTIGYLETMCARCAERGTTPATPRTASAVVPPTRERAKPDETEAEKNARIRRDCAAYDISTYRGDPYRGPRTA